MTSRVKSNAAIGREGPAQPAGARTTGGGPWSGGRRGAQQSERSASPGESFASRTPPHDAGTSGGMIRPPTPHEAAMSSRVSALVLRSLTLALTLALAAAAP